MVSSWIFPLILAASGAGAAVQETRRTLSVTATVTENCSVSTAGRTRIACSPGTSWTRSAVRSQAANRVDRDASYLTITY